MNKLNLSPNKKIKPIIYCYTTPNDKEHIGYCKIGYTEKETADECIYKQSRRTDTECKKEWETIAMFDGGNYSTFTDKDFHKYLTNVWNIERKESAYSGKRAPEYFKITPEKARDLIDKFKKMELPSDLQKDYTLRNEQADAIEQMKNYIAQSQKKEFLLNAKPRFGKTLTIYDYIKRNNYRNILIITNRPVIASSWYDDYKKFLDENEFKFVSNCQTVQNKEDCLRYSEYEKKFKDKKLIYFVSLQDIKGSKWFGGNFNKLKEIKDIKWDILCVDESHEAIETLKSEIAFDHISRNETIFLSGTPFKQIANEKFSKDAIFNWTYADEQSAKENWNNEEDDCNPYSNLPRLNLYTYRMDKMFDCEDFEFGENREKFFNLNEFFETDNKKKFTYEADVEAFLEVISTNEKYPYGSEENREKIKHSIWLLDRVDSAKALAEKLKQSDVFKQYKIVLAAGDGKINDEEKQVESLKKVKEAINKYDKTITLSVGQLTTGVTIPEWNAIMMLCNVKSPALYLQAAFRVQNPCTSYDSNGYQYLRKEEAYIFDFDTARTLDIMIQFANDLYSETAQGKGETSKREKNISELIKYLPIFGENENNELERLIPKDIIAIPTKIKSLEIVKQGFMSNFLFQNVGKIFNDEKALEILQGIKETKELKSNSDYQNVSYDEVGNVKANEEKIIDNTIDIENKIENSLPNTKEFYSNLKEEISPERSFIETIKEIKTGDNSRVESNCTCVDEVTDYRIEEMAEIISQEIKEKYENGQNSSKLKNEIISSYKSERKKIEIDYKIKIEELKGKKESLENTTNKDEYKETVLEYKNKIEELEIDFICALETLDNKYKNDVVIDKVKELESQKQEKINKKAENERIFPKLKSFARSIPSFLMAYGKEDTKCTDLGKIVPQDIFEELTGIKLSDYLYFLEKDYFNQDSFNDAIREFFSLKKKLANYFDNDSYEDIFDYIPPQKTNQIFTPKKVVIQMVNLLEKNNPCCFDNPNKTFIDLYMKSGLYISEIVKRLFRSEKMKSLFPNEEERLKHIFKNQVYGLAPTEIIYRICLNYILGFADDISKIENNIKLLDALPYAKEGTLENKLNEIFG